LTALEVELMDTIPGVLDIDPAEAACGMVGGGKRAGQGG
jgi:hypothetical protein